MALLPFSLLRLDRMNAEWTLASPKRCKLKETLLMFLDEKKKLISILQKK
jgi:hypothetical protein